MHGCAQVVFERLSQPAFLEHVAQMGNLLQQGLNNLNLPAIKQVRGRGLIAGVQVDLQRLGVQDVSPILAKYGQDN